ncbi:MAG: molybdate ABC transporter permease subunit [Chitinophagales bacterium]|nr:molybdate ABC transporter permease subunit [Chitinophagales bacterium]
MFDWDPILLSLKLASVTTVILLILAIPIAYWLVYSRFKFKAVVEAIISLPLILPPTVLGFYLLLAFSPSFFTGSILNSLFGTSIAFSFFGLVVASVIYSLPFMVHPIRSGLSNLPESYSDVSKVLGKSKLTTLFKVLLPNIKPSLLTGIVLAFAHTLGEFGVVLMIGGNIPSETRVASIAIYDEVESLNYASANTYSLILLVLAFIILLLVSSYNRNYLSRFWK